MKSSYPDPSITNQIEFYSGAFHIKRLLRRRGLQNVEPMNGEVWGFMPPDLFKEWSSFTKRQRLVRKRDGGKEFERFVAQIIAQYYCNPATFSNKVLDLSPGGDYDILVEAPGETLFHFETKTTIKRSSKSISIPNMWNFLVRDSRLGADMSVFLLDANFDLEEKLLRVFEILYALAERLTHRGEPRNIEEVSPDWLLQGDPNSITAFHKEIEDGIYYLFYPVLVINGGDNIRKNIGKAISLYYDGVRLVSPYSRLSQERTGSIFHKLPHWKDLPTKIMKEKIRRRIMEIVGW